jgi:hypothetical protein
VLFSLLEMIQSQSDSFMSSQAAGEQEGEQGSVSFSFQTLTIGCLPERLTLLCRQPVSEADSQLFHALDAANPSRKVSIEEAAVGCLVGETPHRAKAQVDRTGRELTGFEMRAVAQNNSPIERQARFRTIPVDEFVDGVTVSPLGIWRGKAIQNCELGMFEIR